MFNECGGVLVPPAFLDFGSKLRDLANEYTALTNPDVHFSSVQKSLYGKRVPPSRFADLCVELSVFLLDLL